MNKKLAVQPLSENTRKAIIIAAIVLVAVIILSVSLALILRPVEKLPDDQNSGSTGSSSLTIRNGDFAYTSSEGTAFPKTAQNWTRYGYKTKSGSDTHDFESISTHEKAVMGIINTSEDEDVEDNWNTVVSDLAEEGVNIASNPGKPNKDADDDNIYMIATREATAASILSDSFSITSGSSVKITFWLNTSQLTEGNAVIMIQKSTVSALSKYWYAYNFEVGKQDGWQQYTFHIFNRENSTQYLRVSIGIGNVYSGEEYTDDGDLLFDDGEVINGSGVLFIDEIEYEKVNADEYRQVVDGLAEGSVDETDTLHPYKIIENDEITDDSIYLPLKAEDGTEVNELGYDEYLEDATYSPFTKKDDFVQREPDDDSEPFSIYKITNTSNKGTIGLRLEAKELNNILSSLIRKDHHHISFWVRVNRVNKVAKANVHVQFKEDPDAEWKDLKNGSWTAITTSQDLDTDSNAGWVKYDIYIKPSAVSTNVSVLFTFGDEKEDKLAAKGSLYVTKPAYEKISYKDYNNASAGSSVKKFDLIGNSATASITNGSFSSLSNSGLQPSGWTAAFAGDNSIYRDGRGNKFDIDRSTKAVLGSGIANNQSLLPSLSSGGDSDDAQRKALIIKNTVETSYGYMSSDISLSSRTAYVISVLARSKDNSTGNPYIYLLSTDTSLDRDDRVIAKIESKDAQSLSDEAEKLLGQQYATSELQNDWVRYYFIVVTGSSSRTVRLALFNGSLDGQKLETGTVYYDQAEILSLGSYSLEKYEDPAEGSYEETHYNVVWTDHPYAESNDGFGKNFGELLVQNVEDSEDNLLESWGISVDQPSDADWEEMRLIPEEKEEDPGDDDKDTTTPSDVDLGLLFSVISSVALLAAMLVVLVLRLFKEGKFKRKAA